MTKREQVGCRLIRRLPTDSLRDYVETSHLCRSTVAGEHLLCVSLRAHRAPQGLEGLLQEQPADSQRGRLPPPTVIQRSASITGGSGLRPRMGAIDDAARSSSLRWRGSDAGSEFDFAVSARG